MFSQTVFYRTHLLGIFAHNLDERKIQNARHAQVGINFWHTPQLHETLKHEQKIHVVKLRQIPIGMFFRYSIPSCTKIYSGHTYQYCRRYAFPLAPMQVDEVCASGHTSVHIGHARVQAALLPLTFLDRALVDPFFGSDQGLGLGTRGYHCKELPVLPELELLFANLGTSGYHCK